MKKTLTEAGGCAVDGGSELLPSISRFVHSLLVVEMRNELSDDYATTNELEPTPEQMVATAIPIE